LGRLRVAGDGPGEAHSTMVADDEAGETQATTSGNVVLLACGMTSRCLAGIWYDVSEGHQERVRRTHAFVLRLAVDGQRRGGVVVFRAVVAVVGPLMGAARGEEVR
jgi:hypothetical protein